MGLTGSTESIIALDGDDEGTFVTISEAVAKRLMGKESNVPTAFNEEEKPPAADRLSSSILNREDLKILEKYYQNRLKAVEAQNKILRQTSEESFTSAVKEVEEKFLKPLPSCSICEEFQNSVAVCYKSNKNATINCSKEVKAFKNCVAQHREAVLGKNG